MSFDVEKLAEEIREEREERVVVIYEYEAWLSRKEAEIKARLRPGRVDLEPTD